MAMPSTLGSTGSGRVSMEPDRVRYGVREGGATETQTNAALACATTAATHCLPRCTLHDCTE